MVVLHASEPFSWNEIMPDYAGIGKVTYPQTTSSRVPNHSRAVLNTRRMLPGNTEERRLPTYGSDPLSCLSGEGYTFAREVVRAG